MIFMTEATAQESKEISEQMANMYQKMVGQGLILPVLLGQDETVITMFPNIWVCLWPEFQQGVKGAITQKNLLVILMHKAEECQQFYLQKDLSPLSINKYVLISDHANLSQDSFNILCLLLHQNLQPQL